MCLVARGKVKEAGSKNTKWENSRDRYGHTEADLKG